MKLTLAQRQMVEDGFPRELFRTAEQRAAWWDAHPPKAMPLFELNKTRDESPETAAFRAQEEERRRIKSLQSIDRMKARMATKAVDFSKMRWDSMKCKFVPLEGAPVATGGDRSRVQDRPQEVSKVRRTPVPTSGDPIWFRVNKDSAERLAKLNGVWDDKYAKLSGGLLVMTVTNRLKGLVKKGGEVKWQ